LYDHVIYWESSIVLCIVMSISSHDVEAYINLLTICVAIGFPYVDRITPVRLI